MVLGANPSARARAGFTLVELIVAAVIAALVAGSAVGAVSQMLKLKSKSAARQQAYERADVAAARIALDLCNIVRHHNLQFARVTVSDGGAGDTAHDGLLLLTRSSRPVRNEEDGVEGGEYEVQYRVGPMGGQDNAQALWRRCDPAHDPTRMRAESRRPWSEASSLSRSAHTTATSGSTRGTRIRTVTRTPCRWS